ncbi:MAG: sensor histidine kinase [Candidatus Coproplasma sp.]
MKKRIDKRDKHLTNTHFIIIGGLSFLLVLIVGELVVYIVQTVNEGLVADASLIMLFIIPSLAAIVTAVIIYFNHRTLQTSNTLMSALNRVADGDYTVKIPYKKLDTFTAVYENFNKMTDELSGVKSLREDFVHNFSHEFKTPIASINGFANLLLDGSLSEEEQRNVLKIIADESERLSHLAESTLMLSKIESQQFVGEVKEFRLDEQIRNCIILLERQWEEKNIAITSSLVPVNYYGDEMMLKQVWLNLISNAVKYTPAGGAVNVTLTEEGGRYVIKVEDNGVGIPEECLPRIFDKYYQASDSSGNGLGLAVCKRILEICKGSITVESVVNQGSVFTVALYKY